MISQPTFFSFDSYRIEKDGQTITFLYSQGFEGGRVASFQDKIILPDKIKASVSKELLDSILHSLHLILGISYWKMYCSKEIKIQTKPLSHEQAEFWNMVYTKGLGEFFYRNEIDFRDLVAFPHSYDVQSEPAISPKKNRSLVGIAGGKDSLVSLELLKKAKKDITGVVIETNHAFGLIRSLLKETSLSTLFVRHVLDEKINALNETGLVYNGHVPVSAMYAIIMILAAAVYDYKYVVVSNEKSANFGNVLYHGMEVNHQWSKSEEFEMAFRSYVSTFITRDIQYFSLLRPLTEIKIVEQFSKYKNYFHYFSSCNKNFTIFKEVSSKHWCGKCPKCAFMFLMMSAFLSKKEVTFIFGKNLLADAKLVPLYRQLLGIEDFKPFDCVGTFEEVTVAFYMAYKKKEYTSDSAIVMFEKLVLPGIKDISKLRQHLLAIGDKNLLPKEFKNIL